MWTAHLNKEMKKYSAPRVGAYRLHSSFPESYTTVTTLLSLHLVHTATAYKWNYKGWAFVIRKENKEMCLFACQRDFVGVTGSTVSGLQYRLIRPESLFSDYPGPRPNALRKRTNKKRLMAVFLWFLLFRNVKDRFATGQSPLGVWAFRMPLSKALSVGDCPLLPVFYI